MRQDLLMTLDSLEQELAALELAAAEFSTVKKLVQPSIEYAKCEIAKIKNQAVPNSMIAHSLTVRCNNIAITLNAEISAIQKQQLEPTLTSDALNRLASIARAANSLEQRMVSYHSDLVKDFQTRGRAKSSPLKRKSADEEKVAAPPRLTAATLPTSTPNKKPSLFSAPLRRSPKNHPSSQAYASTSIFSPAQKSRKLDEKDAGKKTQTPKRSTTFHN